MIRLHRCLIGQTRSNRVSKRCVSRYCSTVQLCYSALHQLACQLKKPFAVAAVIRRSIGAVSYMGHLSAATHEPGDHFEHRARGQKIKNHAQDVYQIPRNIGILGDRPISSLKHTRGSRRTPTSGNADSLSIRVYCIHMTQATLYPVPPCCFCEESLEDVHLEPVRASTKGKEESQGTYIAMAMTANVSNTAYQNRRLGRRGERRCQWDVCTKCEHSAPLCGLHDRKPTVFACVKAR